MDMVTWRQLKKYWRNIIKMNTVTVLLSTYNGEKFLKEQIDSILSQSNVKIHIYARDDGSIDSTLDILNNYKINFYKGENIGPKNSFFDLIKNVEGTSEYYAFSDQDDIWDEDKLMIGIKSLEKYNLIPAVYFCERNIYKEGKVISKTDCNELIRFPTVFFKSLAAGCTIILNKKMLFLLKKYTPIYTPMHDSWTILLASLFGKVIYDNIPHISYRIHENNAVGILEKKYRVTNFIRRQFTTNNYRRSFVALDLLAGFSTELSESKENYSFIKMMAKDSVLSRIKLFLYSKRYSKHIADEIAIRIQIIRGII